MLRLEMQLQTGERENDFGRVMEIGSLDCVLLRSGSTALSFPFQTEEPLHG